MSWHVETIGKYWMMTVLVLNMAVTPVMTQTKWFKYEGNPVFDVGEPGAWDDEWIDISRVMVADSVYQMWYGGGWHKVQIGRATSSDGISWKRDRRNPVLGRRQGTWEENVHRPYVIRANSLYHMWFTGDNIASFRTGYACSTDGAIWERYRHIPVLDVGPTGAWDEAFAALASVVGPDSLGRYQLWYQGKHHRLGYATATNETTWTKYPDPVFWADGEAWYPKVIFGGNTYEMWYGYRNPLRSQRINTNPQPGVFGYATSTDGLHWSESPDNPVMWPGPNGAWDAGGLLTGDIFFDGQLYHLWYNGNDGTIKWRGGYAISPKGMTISISPSNAFVKSGIDSVRIAVHLGEHRALSAYAKIRSPIGIDNPEDPIELLGMQQDTLLELLDDGNHGDSLASDGLLANSWIPTEEALYFVDLKLRVGHKGTHDFEMNKAAVFTTIGPLVCEAVDILGNQSRNSGDTILIRLTLRNKGLIASARSVSASLSTRDRSIVSITELSPVYGDIPAGKTAITLGYYRVLVNSSSPFETDAKIDVSISSWGNPFWHDSFAIRVVPPWWRAWWALGIYSLSFLGMIYSAYRLRLKQVRLRQRAEMDHFQAERLAEVDRLKSRFFSNISHEFRTPLTLILGPAEQGMETSGDQAARQKFHLIQMNARKLYALVSQLLDFSRLESGMMRLQVAEDDLVSFLRRVVLSFESWAERKHIALDFHADVESMVGLFDADKVEKILNNLVSNALKFTSEQGAVDVAMKGGGEFVVITVSDTGIGLAPDQVPKIFDRFYRVNDNHNTEGTGIGLALTKELVDLHHGTIAVESTVGQGSLFTVTLPIRKSAYREDEIVGSPSQRFENDHIALAEDVGTAGRVQASSTSNGKPVVLVVEDNADLRTYIRESFDADYAILEASDGRNGLDKAIEQMPDLVISDVMMPEMDGIELCKALKQDLRTSHIPVILLTARAAIENKIEGLDIGADDYVTKPFETKELAARTRNLIEQRRQLRKKFSAGVVLKPGEVAVTSLDDALLKRLMEIVEQNIGNENFSIDELAREACLSRTHLNRKLQALTNFSSAEFIRYIRLQRAKGLLEKKAGSVADVAFQVGFASLAYFSSCFHKQFGYPPSEIHRKNQKSEVRGQASET